MPEYLVTWMIDIVADGPVEAAAQALAIQRDPSSEATVFEVTHIETQKTVQVELDTEEVKFL